MKTWQFISDSISAGLKTVLLFVVDSQGSSPGRKGFCMAVNESGEFSGTIGGGIMEIKLIELAKHKLANDQLDGMIKLQFHDKEKTKNRSGLICSGRQIVALVPVSKSELALIEKLNASESDINIKITSTGIIEHLDEDFKESIEINHEGSFECHVTVKHMPVIHVFGAGHVGVALSNQMAMLGFAVRLYDNRDDLNTLNNLQQGIRFIQIDYQTLDHSFSTVASDFTVITSYSYNDDKILIKQLYKYSFSYIGMMGSDAKIRQLKNELAEEGISESELQHVHTPIGIPIYSKSAEEIAVSIAAQIIGIKNKHLPTGRNYQLES